MIKNNLKKIRKLRRYTQKQLADELNVSKQVISMWENNPNEKIPDERLRKIAEFLKVEMVDITENEIDEGKIEAINIYDDLKELEERYDISRDKEEKDSILSDIYTLRNYIDASEIHDEIMKEYEEVHLEEVTFPSGRLEILSGFIKSLNGSGTENLNTFRMFVNLFEEGDSKKVQFLSRIVNYLSLISENDGYKFNDDIFWYLLVNEKDTKILGELFLNNSSTK